jgi:HSP20 family molecular chaperone IbpA
MTELMAKSGTTRLLVGAVVLFCIIIFLQLGLLLQRHLGRPVSPPTPPVVPSVWSQADEIRAMFARVLDESERRNAAFDEGWARLQVTPDFNIQDHDTAYEVAIRLPGVDKSGIRITLNGAVLSIVAQQEYQQTAESSPRGARQIRRASQRFERHLRLPGATSEASKIKAAFTNDLLMILIPKEAAPDLVPRPVQVY